MSNVQRVGSVSSNALEHTKTFRSLAYRRWDGGISCCIDVALGDAHERLPMLRNLHDLEGFAIGATDGDIGKVTDFYFDDEAWVIRYMVVETGGWLASRKVLISPISIGHPDLGKKIVPASITRDQVRKSPDIDTEKPISRQHETRYLDYYGYPVYWGGPGLSRVGGRPDVLMPEFVSTPEVVEPQFDDTYTDASAARGDGEDTRLRSCNVVVGYHTRASDGEIGHVQGMLVDDETWVIRYLVVNTSNWWLGHQVLITPEQVHDISWLDRTIVLDVTRQKVKDAPPYDASFQLERMHEVSVYKHYGNMAYWAREESANSSRATPRR